MFGDARTVAGEPRWGLSLKCALTPLRPEALPGLTATQFAALRSAFADGRCDWSKPPVGYRVAAPWLSFSVGTGGHPLGPPPRSVPTRG